MWIYLILLGAKNIQLKDMKQLSPIEKNCTSTHKFIENNQGKLVNLISVFRHGDRVPLNIQDQAWKTKSCIQCGDSCKSIPCTGGMLTKKGYVQSKKLGDFIKKFYVSKMKNIEMVYGYHSKLDRSISTLHGVLATIDHSKYVVSLENTIISSQNESILKNYLLRKHLEKINRLNSREYALYDEIVTSYCSETAFNCSKFPCNAHKILSFVNQQQNNFVYSSNIIKTSPIAIGISFGRFGEFLKKEITKMNSVTLVSGHDSTIIKVLSGLNITLKVFPGYTSAVFVEVWEYPTKTKYVRIIYNGEIMKFGLYNEEYVEFDSFIKYIEMFTKANTKIDEFDTLDAPEVKSINEIKKITISVKNAYKPLIKEFEKNGIEFSKELENKFLDEVNQESEKSFLFGFGGSKNQTEKYQIEVKDEKTGNSKMEVIECENKKCKQVSVKENKKPDDDTKKDNNNCNSNCDDCRSKNNNCNNSCDDSKSKNNNCNDCEFKNNNCNDCKFKNNNCTDIKPKSDSCNDVKSKNNNCDNVKSKNNNCDDCKSKNNCKLDNNNNCKSSCDDPLSNISKNPNLKTVCDTKSAFDDLPGTCKYFDNTECEYFKKLANPKACNEKYKPISKESDCGNVSPGVWILN